MGIVSRIMGIPMFLTALWLAWVVFRQSGYEGLIILISSLMILLVAFLILRLSSVIAKRSSVAFNISQHPFSYIFHSS